MDHSIKQVDAKESKRISGHRKQCGDGQREGGWMDVGKRDWGMGTSAIVSAIEIKFKKSMWELNSYIPQLRVYLGSIYFKIILNCQENAFHTNSFMP